MGRSTAEKRRSRFESIYDAYRMPVLAYCMRRMPAEDAGDACSETFLVAWRRLDDVPDDPETLPFLYGIAAKVLANQNRSARRHTRLKAKLNGLGVTQSDDPSALVLKNSQHQEVLDALERLKPRDREIIMLYTWEDLPREAISRMLGMSKAAVDQRIHRAYKKLARILKPANESSRSTLLRVAREKNA